MNNRASSKEPTEKPQEENISPSPRRNKRRISSRLRILLLITIVTVVSIGVLTIIIAVILENRFSALERANGEESTERVLQALAQETTDLDASANDWARWDDTYAYAEDGNKAYQTSKLTKSTFAVLRLNWVVILNTEGTIVFGAHYDAGTDTLTPLDRNRLHDLGLWPLPAQEVGLVVGTDGPLLASIQPILTSEQAGPSHGTLIFGRALDLAFLENLSRVTLYPVSFLPLEPLQAPVNAPTPERTELAHGTPHLFALDAEHFVSDTILLDLSDRPAVQMRIVMPRPIMRESRSTHLTLFFLLLALGLFAALLTSWILDRFFLRRLDRLSTEVGRIGRGEGNPVALVIGGNDEIALLARTVRETLTGLQNSERRYRELVENLAEGVAIIDKADAFLYLNPACERTFGASGASLLGHSPKEFIDPAEHEAVDRQAARRQNKESSQYENTILRPDGSRRRVLVSSVPQYDGRGQVSGTLSIILDITDRKRAEETIKHQLTEIAAYYDNAPIGLAVLDTDLRFVRINRLLAEINGIPVAEHLGKTMGEIVPALEKQAQQVVRSILTTGKPITEIEFTGQTAAQPGVQRVWLEGWYPLKSEDNTVTGFMVIVQDITERKQLQQKLEEMATHDFLTGLPNRALLLDRFTIAAALAHRNQTGLAVMSLDLDKFKSVNDTLGHDAGDQMLKLISARLAGIIRASDTIARVGGDEFILVMSETKRMEDATAIAQKILDSFAEPFSIDDHPLQLSTSIGIAIYPEDAEDLETLTKKSDAAMYYSKGHGRNQYKFYGDGDVKIGGDYKSAN